MNLVLASASPARLATLRAAGLDPVVVVSDVDEDALLAAMPDAAAADKVVALARAKAEQVAGSETESVVIGCDSMFEMDGEVRGKPIDRQDAVRRLRRMQGSHGTLFTGHHVVNTQNGANRSAAASTEVHIGPMTDHEIERYVDTGEPLRVAGSFTIDGLGGWFIDRVDGDHTNVIGISLPLVRRMLHEIDIDITSFFPTASSPAPLLPHRPTPPPTTPPAPTSSPVPAT